MTKENGHHSVYDHIYMTLNIKNVPKILAMVQTKKTLSNFIINTQNEDIKMNIEQYIKGARCTFPDYTCNSCCNFKEGITLKRKI